MTVGFYCSKVLLLCAVADSNAFRLVRRHTSFSQWYFLHCFCAIFWLSVLQCDTHTHTYPFNGPFTGTTWVIRYQKGKTNLDFTEARDSEWQWHQLGHMQVCTSLQADDHTSTSPLCFCRLVPFLPPNQQRQSSEGSTTVWYVPVTNILSLTVHFWCSLYFASLTIESCTVLFM